MERKLSFDDVASSLRVLAYHKSCVENRLSDRADQETRGS